MKIEFCHDNLIIRGHIFGNKSHPQDAVILSHGFMANERMCYKYAKLLADMGFQDVIRRLHPVEVPNVPYGSEELIKTVWKIKNGEKDG